MARWAVLKSKANLCRTGRLACVWACAEQTDGWRMWGAPRRGCWPSWKARISSAFSQGWASRSSLGPKLSACLVERARPGDPGGSGSWCQLAHQLPGESVGAIWHSCVMAGRQKCYPFSLPLDALCPWTVLCVSALEVNQIWDTGDVGSIPRLGRFPWRKKWLPSPAFLPGESYGQRSLEGYSLWGHRKVRHDWTYIHSFNWQKYLKVKVKLLSRVRLVATPWTVAYQAPLSMGFSRQEHWSGLPFPSPDHLPNPGIEPRSPAL